MIVRVSSSNGRAGIPNRVRKFTTGITDPRRLINPSIDAGTWGILVIGFITMISWIVVIGMA